ncbi:MAG: hypothetical protein Wins2KO_13070 [Winogradskyella sp.]
MKNKMMYYPAALILVLLFVLITILRLVISTVNESNDCDQLVTDTNELFASIDVPQKSIYEFCDYDKKQKRRVSSYIIEGNHDFVSKNNLDRVKDINHLKELDSLTVNEWNSELYFKTNKKWNRKSIVIFNASNNRLKFIITEL